MDDLSHHVIRRTIDLDELAWDPAWPTQREDILMALAIIERHQRQAGGALRVLEAWGEEPDGALWVRLPAWLAELIAAFEYRYGEAGATRLQRVMGVLVPAETVH